MIMAKPRILVIEDRLDVLTLIQCLLGQAGGEVASASTGREGLRLALAERFDVITLDIDLPDVGGMEVCRRIKQDVPPQKTPVVFVSSHSANDDEFPWADCGAVDFIAKPFDARKFAPRILGHIREKP